MKYFFLIFFSTLVFGETYLTFQRNSTALVQNGFETIEAESTATNQAAYFPLYANALDYSQNDNDGTVYGAVSTGSNYWFDGVDDYISANNIPSNILNSQSGTIMMYLNFDDITSGGIAFSFGKSTINDTWIMCRIRDNKMKFQQRNNNDTYDIVSSDDLGTVTGSWLHVAFASDGSQYYLYANGVQQTINVDHGSNSGDWMGDCSGIDRCTIGALIRNTYANPFDGYIKDIRIYDKALTADEINKIYNATKQ